MSRGALLSFVCLVACGGGAPAARVARTKPTDADACARFCETMRACGDAPAQCEVRCGRDQKKLRAGFMASFVSCLEDQSPVTGCDDAPARKQHVSLCHAATVEAYAQREGGEAMKKVIAAVCTRRARCAGEPATKKACIDSLGAQTANSSQSKTLSTANEALIATLAACVEARACDDEEPVASCQSAEDGPTL